jgi:hypothetical protein
MAVTINTNNITTVQNLDGTYTVTIPGTNSLDTPTIVSIDGFPNGQPFEYYADQSVNNAPGTHNWQAVFPSVPAGDYSAYAQDTSVPPNTYGPVPCPVPYENTVGLAAPLDDEKVLAVYYPNQAADILEVDKVPSPLVFAGFALAGPPSKPFHSNSPRVHFIKTLADGRVLVISSISTLIGYHWQFTFPILPSGPAKLRAHFPDGSCMTEVNVNIV